jgi:hypothetical protein
MVALNHKTEPSRGAGGPCEYCSAVSPIGSVQSVASSTVAFNLR